jgi:PAS domain S-box-containing protein
MKLFRPNLSLRSKIILLVSGTAFFGTALIGLLDSQYTREIALEKAIAKLAGQTRIASLEVKSAYDEMKNDAFVLAHTPPILGLSRAIRNNGIDPKDGSTRDLWQIRLNTIFASLIKVRPTYTQIRYIGLGDDGRELVRVNKDQNGKIEVVAPENLQQKVKEPYFRPGSELPPEAVYFSEITYNREQGEVTPQLIPTIRAILPVFDDLGRRFGMIVINANYEKMLRNALRSLDVEEEIYISDNLGNYLFRDRLGVISDLEVAGHWNGPPPSFLQDFLTSSRTEGRISEKDRIGYFHRREVATPHSKATIGAFLLAPKSGLLAETLLFVDRNVIIAVLVVIASGAAAALFSNHLTKPMAQMTEGMKACAAGTRKPAEISLPVELDDEVGEMARAFRHLIEQLDLSHADRTKLSAQFEAFIATCADAVVIIDERGTIEQVNPACSEQFGYERDELIGSNVSMLMPDAIGEKHDDYLRAYRESGVKSYIGTIRDEAAKHKDGTIFPVALAIGEGRIGARRIFTGIIRDMTAVMEIQRNVEHYAAELERSNRELDQFAYVASHDLKAPLRVIDNASRWLEEDLKDKLGDDDRENIALLRSRVRRMEKLLDDLLTYSRVGRTAKLEEEIVDAHSLIEDVLVMLGPRKTMKVTIADALSAIQVDRSPLQQIFQNLISNAIKHHDRESGTIGIGATETEQFFRFTVKDDGPGIPPEFQEQIFGMFQTLKPRDQVEGSGMGLALVKKILERFGGEISVESGPGRGTAFIFTWPKVQNVNIGSERAA